jgi:D-alanyl-D-alanine carboxypeptidase
MNRSTLLAVATVFIAACGVEVGGDEVPIEEEDEYLDPGVQEGDAKMDGQTTVQAIVASTCSTAPVRGLSLQIAEEIGCIAPDMLVRFEETANLKFQSGAVLPYLSSETADALKRAAPTVGEVEINSGLRSIAQQFLLKKWRDAGRCGIRAAATPGRSNHETGRALDLGNSAEARRTMQKMGFTTLRNDPVHFDHLASPDLRSVNVEAFQRLWNRNNPNDRIDEDGMYGSATATRLGKSPSGGFAQGADCGAET